MSRWWMIASGLAAAVVALAACSQAASTPGDGGGDAAIDPGPDPTDGAHSGGRLKIVWWQAPDGFRTWSNTFHDTVRGEDCVTSTFGDGSRRCVPNAATAVFSDAACAKPIGLDYPTPCAPAPRYAARYGYDGCGGGIDRVYGLGAKLATTQYYDLDTTGACRGPYSASGVNLYASSGEIAATEFATLTVREDATGSPLHHRYLTTDDGLQLPSGSFDPANGTSCYPRGRSGYAAAECAPDDAMYGGYATDAACTQAIGGYAHTCAARHTPRFAQRSSKTCPGDPTTYVDVGGTFTPSSLFIDVGTCIATSTSPTYDYFRLGAPVALPAMTRAFDHTAGHRLQSIYLSAGASFRSRDYLVYDSAKNTECYLAADDTGQIRCLPSGPGSLRSDLYSDAACKQPIDVYEVVTGAATCTPPMIGALASKYVGGTCGNAVEPHPIGAKITATLYQQGAAGCSAYRPTTANDYQLGAALPLTELATATRMVDP